MLHTVLMCWTRLAAGEGFCFASLKAGELVSRVDSRTMSGDGLVDLNEIRDR